MKYSVEHIENMDGHDPTEKVRMPPEVMELKLEDEQNRKGTRKCQVLTTFQKASI